MNGKYFCRDKKIFSLNNSLADFLAYRIAYFFLIFVNSSGIKMPIANFYCSFYCTFYLSWLRLNLILTLSIKVNIMSKALSKPEMCQAQESASEPH